jgi:uncharacterized membrane protein YeaQ/YmgE (transglycosylase-associated protein family)
MSTQEAAGRRLRSGAAAAIAAAGVLIPMGYAAVASQAYAGPFAGAVAGFVLLVLVVCLAIAGLLAAALVRGWDGTGPLLAGLLVGCVAAEVAYVVMMDETVDVDETVQLFVICAVPLLVGYGVGRGLARLG